MARTALLALLALAVLLPSCASAEDTPKLRAVGGQGGMQSGVFEVAITDGGAGIKWTHDEAGNLVVVVAACVTPDAQAAYLGCTYVTP